MGFRAETCSKGPGKVLGALADLLLTALMSSCESGPPIILRTTEVVQQAEERLESLLDEGRDSDPEYAVIARQRSAAKSIARRLQNVQCLHSDVANALHNLEAAIQSLDKSVDSYMYEGHWHAGYYVLSS